LPNDAADSALVYVPRGLSRFRRQGIDPQRRAPAEPYQTPAMRRAERITAVSKIAPVWTIHIFGSRESHLDNSLYLGASSLPMLIQSLARYELKPVT